MEKKSLLNTIENLASFAKKGNWQLFYDKLSDSLYWSKEKISKDSKLRKLSMEVSFYVNRVGGVEGLLIQCFRNNFLTQNQDLAKTGFIKMVTDIGKVKITSSKEEGKFDAMIFGFSESIKKDIFKDALDAHYTTKDLEKSLLV